MNEFKLNQCLQALDRLVAERPDVLKADAVAFLQKECCTDFVDASLAVHTWAVVRSQLEARPKWADV